MQIIVDPKVSVLMLPVPNKKRLRILHVDDMAELREIVRLSLEREGHTVESYADGIAALNRLREAPTLFDLFMSDHHMPKMNGLELVKQLRKLDFRGKIFIFSSEIDEDVNDPQGHGKAEPLAAVMVALFLFLAAFGIAYESIERIRTPHRMPAPWTLLVLLGVVAIKEALVRFSLKVGEETGSNAVKADALHQRTDTLTSVAAFVFPTDYKSVVGRVGRNFY